MNAIKLTTDAQRNVEEAGINPMDDVTALRSGEQTRESLLAACLDGADDDRVEGWRDYVAAVAAAAAGA